MLAGETLLRPGVTPSTRVDSARVDASPRRFTLTCLQTADESTQRFVTVAVIWLFGIKHGLTVCGSAGLLLRRGVFAVGSG